VTGGPSWEFTAPSRFTAGAVGEPGSRVFYFQVFAEGQEVNVKCEKQQALALAEHVVNLLRDLPEDVATPEVPAAEALPPTDLAWVVGSISIGLDRSHQQVVVLLEEVVFDEDGPTEGTGRLRVHLSPAQVQGFARQMAALEAQRRPICRLCEQPIDPSGHACPRLN